MTSNYATDTVVLGTEEAHPQDNARRTADTWWRCGQEEDCREPGCAVHDDYYWTDMGWDGMPSNRLCAYCRAEPAMRSGGVLCIDCYARVDLCPGCGDEYVPTGELCCYCEAAQKAEIQAATEEAWPECGNCGTKLADSTHPDGSVCRPCQSAGAKI